jgi:hypothetical protein
VEVMAPRILNLGTRWRWVITFTPQPLYSQGKSLRHPMNLRLGWPQNRSGRGGRKKSFLPGPCRECNVGRASRSLVIILEGLYKSQNSSLCKVLSFPQASCTLLPEICTLCTLRARDHIS